MKNSDIFSFKKKKVVVTGGCGLIGSAISESFLRSQACVIVADLVGPKTLATVAKLKRRYGGVYFEAFDVTQLSKLQRCVRELDKKYKGIDVWVNSAYPRTGDWNDRLEKVSHESFRQNVDGQLNACCLISNEIVLLMKSRRCGVLINLASIYGVVAPDFSIYEGTAKTSPAAYSAVKGGVVAYSKYLASYLKNSGVRVNVVCPGGVFNHQPKKFLTNYSRKTLLGRMAMPEEIAWPVIFLASEAASYMTGAVLMVDGGWTAI